MEESRIFIQSLGFGLGAILLFLGIFALESLMTLLVLPLAWLLSGFDEKKTASLLGYSPGQWSEAFWEKNKVFWARWLS